MSGARVVPGHDRRGRPVVVKIAGHDLPGAAAAAARELAVYTRLAPSHRLPTPRLLAARVEEHRTVLVLSRHRPAPAAERWPAELWRALVDALVVVHQTDVPTGTGTWSWTPEPGLLLSGPDRAVVDRLWSEPDDQRCLAVVHEQLAELEAAAAGPDRVLSHGDCHPGNVLLDGDRLLLTDWQGARLGASCADLAFVLIRAVPSGAVVPRDELLARYAAGRGLAPAELGRAVTAAQLLTLTRQYPHFAGYLGAGGRARLRSALHRLTAEWRASR
nr:aminoglycoside phosphotransferase family protein [Auraticoccus cholistanensis]